MPVSVTEVGEFEALLSKEAFAEANPLFCGVNVTVKVKLWPAVIVAGKEIPLTTNSELPKSTEETTTLAPVALSVPVPVPLAPTVTFPKVIVPGVTLSCPCGTAAVDPLNEIARFGFEAFDEIVRLPVKLPEDCGANVTVSDAVSPGPKVSGMLTPELLKLAPAIESCEMVALDPPVFCTVTV